MDKENKTYLKSIVEYIENNISEDIQVEELAKKNYISHMQMYRDFYSSTGHSVKEYVRKRRLAKALLLIKVSDFSLARIAYDSGYSSQQALCRSVKNYIGITPLQYKKGADYFYFPRFRVDSNPYISVSKISFPELICFEFISEDNDLIEERALHEVNEITGGLDGDIYGRNGTAEGKKFSYEIMIENKEGIEEKFLKSNLRYKHIIPPRTITCASSIISKIQDIQFHWDYIFNIWLQSSMFKRSNEKLMEQYILKNSILSKIKIIMPVYKKEESVNITISSMNEKGFLVSRGRFENEEKISHELIKYIQVKAPAILDKKCSFLIYKKGEEFLCGIEVTDKVFQREMDQNRKFVLPKGDYAFLKSDCYDDSKPSEVCLKQWLEEHNVLAVNSDAFVIYHWKPGEDECYMECCFRLKNVKK